MLFIISDFHAMKKLFLLLITYFLTALLAPIFAQQYDFKQYSLEQGLPQSQVLCVMQDSRKMIWGGTYGGGIFRFDGKNFTIFNQEQGFLNQASQIAEADNGNIYMLSQNNLLKYDGKKVISLKSEIEKFTNQSDFFNRDLEIFVDKNKNLWVQSANYQKGVFDILKYDGNSFVTAKGLFKELAKDSLVRITQDQKHRLWFHCFGGLYGYDGIKLEKLQLPKFKEFENCIPIILNEDSKKRKWLMTKSISRNANSHKFYCLENNKLTPFLFPPNTLNMTRILGVFEDKRANIWFYNTGDFNNETGLLRYDGKKFTHFNTSNGLPSDNVLDVIEDHENNLWLATSGGGLVKFSGEKFIHFTKAGGLIDEIVWKFWEDNNKNVFIGTGGGIGKFDNQKFTYTPFKTITTTNNAHLHYQNGMLLRNETKMGHYIFDGNNTKSLLETLSLPKDHEYAWFIGYKDGKKIVQTNQSVITYTDKNNYITSQQDSTLKRFSFKNNKKYFMTDSKGNEWYLEENKAIYSINPTKLSAEKGKNNDKIAGLSYKKYDIFSNDLGSVLNAMEDKQGNIWFVSLSSGVTMYDGKKIRNYTTKDGLSSNIIYDMLTDKSGNMWLMSQKGIEKLILQPDGTLKVRAFGKNEGFFGEETNAGAKMEDSEGNLWFGHVKGATRYNPKEDFVNTTPPQLYLSNLKLFFQSVNWNDSIYNKFHQGTVPFFDVPQNLILPYTINHISFNFTAINYSNPEKIRYQWQLVGADRNWLPVTERHEAIYANLEPNTYTLKVRAVNAEGIWTEQPTEYTFTITPPFWATWWFRTLGIFTVLALTYLAIRWRTDALERERQELERLVKERTNEVVKQKEEIESQRDNLVGLNQAIQQQKEEIETQKDEVEKSYLNVQILSELGRKITATLDTKTIIALTYESVNMLMPAEGFGIGVYDEMNNALFYEGYIENGQVLPDHQDILATDDCFSNWCFLQQKDVIINDIEKDYNKYILNRKAPVAGEAVQSLIYLPLKSDNGIIGVLTVQCFEKNAYNEFHLTILRNIANYVATAIEKASAYKFIATQSKELSIKNEDITASINYAFRIQQAMLPLKTLLCATVPECFVFFQPRDIVSGDFYWFHIIPNQEQQKLHNNDICIIAAVDCTGHGVPGAMMSMIANSLLNKIVIDKGIIAPDKILNEMHLNIRQALKQDTTDSRDGMDMAICLYDKKQHKLVFAGARNSMYVLTDYEIVVENMECRQVKSENYILTEIKADKNPIGGFQHENQRIFTNREIVLQRNKHTTFYLLSDGYEDQFGGEKDRKFSSRQLRELLLNIQTNDMETQHKIIKNTMENWQGKTKQIDDMLIVGVKV